MEHRHATMLNLLSDESDEEQDGEHVYNPCCRNGLYIAQTKLAGSDGGRLPFRGLFASKSLCVGAFVGFYTGDWYTPEKLESMPDVRRRNEYAVSTSGDSRCDEIICSPPVRRHRIDEVKYPVGLANEPGKYSTANCMLVEYKFTMDELTDPSLVPEDLHGEEIVAIGIVTTRPVGAHRELTWHYGSSYHRSYEVGRPTRLPRGLRPEDPIVALGGRIPNEGVCVLVSGA